MLIDASHKKWILGTLLAGAAGVGLWFWENARTPGGLTGGSVLGMWYGIVGSALMVFAGLLSALRRVPTWWWIGSRQFWLRGHIWLGLLSGVFILCHSAFRWGGPLEIALWAVLLVVLASGVFGLALQQFLPRLLTGRVPHEAPYEQIPHLCQVLRRKADAVLQAVWTVNAPASQASIMMHSQMGAGAKIQLQEFYDKQLRPFLAWPSRRGSPLAGVLQAEAAFSRLKALPGLADCRDQVDELAVLYEERRQLAEQERLYHYLHGWLFVHIPLSVVLLVLAVLHVVTALYY